MAHVTAIIPARLSSSRFHGKVLYPIPVGRGKTRPLIYFAWKAACQAKKVNRVFVATDSETIGREVNNFGGAVIMTSSRPRNGTERVAEAATELRSDIIINIQADNMGLSGAVLDRVIEAMSKDRHIRFATLAGIISPDKLDSKLANKNVTKVVGDGRAGGRALWFSRLPVPYNNKKIKDSGDSYPYLEHYGVYFFRREALYDYVSWPRGRAEITESLEQLRILENGEKINLFITRAKIISVDSKKALRGTTKKRK